MNVLETGRTTVIGHHNQFIKEYDEIIPNLSPTLIAFVLDKSSELSRSQLIVVIYRLYKSRISYTNRVSTEERFKNTNIRESCTVQ